MSFQNEDEEEDLSPNLSSEEFNELTNNKSYNGFTINSKKDQEVNIKINENEKDKYKMPSYYTSRNLKESKDKELTDLHFSYEYNNKEIPEIIDNNMNDNSNNKNEKENNINDKNIFISKKMNAENDINKSLEENKNSNLNNQKNDLKYNYQSFLAERLSSIHQNLNDKNEKGKEITDINNKEKNKIQEVDYYKYDNFSKKDIMNYYFNIDNNNNEIKNFNDSIKLDIKMDKSYKINNNNNIKENIQMNNIKLNVSINNNTNNKEIKNESKKENIENVLQKENDFQNKNKLIINNNFKSTNIINNKSTNTAKNLFLDNYIPNNEKTKEFVIINNSGYKTDKNIYPKNIIFPTNKSIDTLESVNIRKMDEEEEGRKIVLEDEYKKLTLLENEKMRLIEEEKMIRQKILEEVEKQEKAEKKMEMRMKYMEKIKKKEEDEKKLNDIKLRQEQELKEINELKNKKKLEEERLALIMEGKLKLNNREIKSYRNNLYYEDKKDNNKEIKTYNNINKKDMITKIQENFLENKNKTIANNDEINIKNKYNKNYKNNFNKEEEDKKNEKINQTINQYITDKREKETNENNIMIFSPSLSSFSNKVPSLTLKSSRNNYETYEPSKSNIDQLISLPLSKKEDKINSESFNLKNKFMTNNPVTDKEKGLNNLYGKKKKKHVKRKRIDSSFNYKTNVYNDKKVFQKLMDNMNYQKQAFKDNNKENEMSEVNKIQEIATRAKNEIDKTISALKNIGKNMNKINLNTERNVIKTSSNLTDNFYLKYGKKDSKQKKEKATWKNLKQNININSRNFNEYLNENIDEIKFQKYPKEDDNDLDKINNDENIDYKNVEKNKYECEQKYKKKFNFNGVLSESNPRFINYYKEIYEKK